MNRNYLLVLFSLFISTLFVSVYYQHAHALIVFGQKADYDVDTTPTSVAAADFNDDNKTDLAVSNGGAGTVSILLGNGDGTFQSATNFTTGEEPEEVVASDFNADDKADLAIANSFDDTISILLGNGDGTFEDAIPYDVGEFPFSITIADFNGDNKNDLAVANGGGFLSSGDISILLGNGDGTFQNAVTYTAGSEPTDIYSSDFNDDNNVDLAVTNSTDHNLSILLGKGDGTFQSAVNYAVGQIPFGVTGGDFNNDQKEDIATANTSTNNVSILLGNGDGTFQTAINYGSGKWPIAVAASDFDHDGTLDLAVANSGNNNLSVLQGTGSGIFQFAANALAGEFPYDLIISDLDGDGFDDLVVVNNDDSDPSEAQERYVVSVLLNKSSTCPLSLILKDSNSALAMIRNFRDTRLALNTQGKRYTDLYYRHASEITIMMIRDDDLLQQATTLMNQLLPTINFLQQGRVTSLSQTMAGKIQSLLNKIEKQASPGLCSSIHELKDTIKHDGFLHNRSSWFLHK